MNASLWQRLPQLLYRSSQVIEEKFAREMAGQDITMRQVILLAGILENPKASQTRLTSVTGIDRSTLADMVKRLRQKGLITRRRNASDARAHQVTITDEGQRIVMIGTAVLARIEEEFVKSIPDRQVDTVISVLMRAVAPSERKQ